MVHSVPSFMVSCSARCHYKQGNPYTPLTTRVYARSPYHPFRAPHGTIWPDPTATSFPRAAPKAITALNNFRPKVLNRRLNFDSNIKSSMVRES
ncbi:hypothetical protein E2C01_096845 [Portunus trituberculatus]|uniref:Uncharacterized protein n=1 Tax=Portunus trituberculatus TaxID=210409 RepID=A0A5B7K9J9_PORTR|nr:hypothetical protein [Portunus trituberculatus]